MRVVSTFQFTAQYGHEIQEGNVSVKKFVRKLTLRVDAQPRIEFQHDAAVEITLMLLRSSEECRFSSNGTIDMVKTLAIT